jgi:hypothetical protein
LCTFKSVVKNFLLLKEDYSVGTSRTVFNPNLVKESYVISRYIDNPLLMGGKKFDLRYIAGLLP